MHESLAQFICVSIVRTSIGVVTSLLVKLYWVVYASYQHVSSVSLFSVSLSSVLAKCYQMLNLKTIQSANSSFISVAA